MKITAKLSDVSRSYDTQVKGIITGDSKARFLDGTVIRTSEVQKVLIVTRNSVYETTLDAIRNEGLTIHLSKRHPADLIQ